MDIGSKLKTYLEESGQRQAAVASKIGYTPANMSRAMMKGYNLNLASALKIADGIGLEVRIEDKDGNKCPNVDVDEFLKAASETRVQWNDAEALLNSLGYFINFDWR